MRLLGVVLVFGFVYLLKVGVCVRFSIYFSLTNLAFLIVFLGLLFVFSGRLIIKISGLS